MPSPRYHTVIFVGTNSDGSGFIHHVTGDFVTGMRYERKIGKIPEESGTFHNKELLGKSFDAVEWAQNRGVEVYWNGHRYSSFVLGKRKLSQS